MRSRILLSLLFVVGCSIQGAGTPPPASCLGGKPCAEGYVCTEAGCLQDCTSAACFSGFRCTSGLCLPCTEEECLSIDMGAAAWDASMPPSDLAACKSGRKGWQLAPRMAACQAGPQLPDQVCNDAQGWTPCQSNRLTDVQCATIPWGFFGARQHGRQDTPTPDATMACTWNGGAGATSTEQRFIFGCGKSAAMVTWDIPSDPCGGFSRAIACHGSPFSAISTWDCPYYTNSDQDADRVSTSDMKDGELCCHA